MRISLRSLMFLPWIFCVSGCVAGDAGETQLSTLQSIMAKGDFSKRDPSPQAPAGFCDALLSDLEAGKNVKVVEPIVETDDPKDPRLAKYEACATYDSRADDERRGGPSPDAFQGLSGTVAADPDITIAVVGDRNFKLFSIEPDGSRPADEIIYGEWSRERLMEGTHLGGYRVIDTKQCMVKGFASVEQEALGKTVRSNYVERMNLLLRYGSDYFVMDLKDLKAYNRQRPEQEPLYTIALYKYDVTHNRKFRMFCAARQQRQKLAQ